MGEDDGVRVRGRMGEGRVRVGSPRRQRRRRAIWRLRWHAAWLARARPVGTQSSLDGTGWRTWVESAGEATAVRMIVRVRGRE